MLEFAELQIKKVSQIAVPVIPVVYNSMTDEVNWEKKAKEPTVIVEKIRTRNWRRKYIAESESQKCLIASNSPSLKALLYTSHPPLKAPQFASQIHHSESAKAQHRTA